MFFITYINNNNQKYSKTAQETVIDLLKENPNINVIKNNSQFFSKYNIKRKIVKLSNNTYDSSSYFSNAVASQYTFLASLDSIKGSVQFVLL